MTSKLLAGRSWVPSRKIPGTILSIDSIADLVFFGTNQGRMFWTIDFASYQESTFENGNSSPINSILVLGPYEVLALTATNLWHSFDGGLSFATGQGPGGNVLKKVSDSIVMIGSTSTPGMVHLVDSFDGHSIRSSYLDNPTVTSWVQTIMRVDQDTWLFGTGENGKVHIHKSIDTIMSTPISKVHEEILTGNSCTKMLPGLNEILCVISSLTSTRILKSQNLGDTWQDVSVNNFNSYGQSSVVSDDGQAILVGGAGGYVYYSFDFGLSFGASDKLDGNSINCLHALQCHSLLATTNGEETNLYISHVQNEELL